jgi:hypothetical protein
MRAIFLNCVLRPDILLHWRDLCQLHATADGTHPLAPILVWFGLHDRLTRVSCSDSGSNYSDELGKAYASDGAVMMAKTKKGRLVKIRLDLVSASPGGSRHVLRACHIIMVV